SFCLISSEAIGNHLSVPKGESVRKTLVLLILPDFIGGNWKSPFSPDRRGCEWETWFPSLATRYSTNKLSTLKKNRN
ncbi:MAG: hypothetical protein WC356_07270, partial [Candidatus Micrarchaeia archaeon]